MNWALKAHNAGGPCSLLFLKYSCLFTIVPIPQSLSKWPSANKCLLLSIETVFFDSSSWADKCFHLFNDQVVPLTPFLSVFPSFHPHGYQQNIGSWNNGQMRACTSWILPLPFYPQTAVLIIDCMYAHNCQTSTPLKKSIPRFLHTIHLQPFLGQW